MANKIRVGAVSYLNTKPLVYRLDEIAPNVEIIYDLPSRLADGLAASELDVALIPSIEYFQDPTYRIVSDACIGCRGPVLSVKLLTRVPFEEIRTLALDEGSRTSVALVRILLQQRFGIEPQLESLPIGRDVSSTTADAMLLIGDRAIHPAQNEFVEEWDLGDEWCRWSELPFVFAMWTARQSADVSSLPPLLEQARDEGVVNLKRIASQEATAVGLSEAECLSYLRDNLYFYLGAREQEGLELFRSHAARLGIVSKHEMV
jgi:chorismate dehydratase